MTRYGYVNKQWMCRDCYTVILGHDLLIAQNPFEDTDTITGCPNCFGINNFIEVCDEPGCIEPATCGFPVKEGFSGYHRTCSEHYRHYTRGIDSHEDAVKVQNQIPHIKPSCLHQVRSITKMDDGRAYSYICKDCGFQWSVMP